jgi:hypothetical protein
VRVRAPGAARADGALRPLPGNDHPYDAVPSAQGGATVEARPRSAAVPTALPGAQGPASARDACGGRAFIAMAVCMDRECDSPRFRDTAECAPILARKRAREGR